MGTDHEAETSALPASVLVWQTDATGRALVDNVSWSTFTGQAADAYRDFGWLDAVHPGRGIACGDRRAV